MEFTTLLLTIAGSFGALVNQDLTEQARKAQECPIVAKGKGYVIYTIPQDVGTALVHLELQTAKMRKLFTPSTSEYHNNSHGMPHHYRYTTTLSAMAVDEQRVYLLSATSTEDLSHGVRGRGFGKWSKVVLPLDLPDKGMLVVTKSGLAVMKSSTSYQLQVYWRQDGRLIHADETRGSEYLIDGKSIKKKPAARSAEK